MRRFVGGLFVAVAIVALGACGGGSSSGGSTSDFCSTLKADQAAFDKLGSDASNASFAAALDDLVKKAPSEIKADMAALAAALKASESFASQIAADPSKSESLASEFSSQEAGLQTALDHITTFAKDKCGIDLNSSSS